MFLESTHRPCIVPGLVDDFQAGIRRGRMTVTGADFEKVFEPVIHEVISLIKGQIESTILPVKAVLLVGGFGQNAYLRDRIRQAVGSNVEVMQSPNR